MSRTIVFLLIFFGCVQLVAAQVEVYVVPFLGKSDTFRTMQDAAKKWFALNRTADNSNESSNTYIGCKKSESGSSVIVIYRHSWLNRNGEGGSNHPEMVTDDPTSDNSNIDIVRLEPEAVIDKLPAATSAPAAAAGAMPAANAPGAGPTTPSGNRPPASDQLLKPDGTFSDKNLENAYGRYLLRKEADNKLREKKGLAAKPARNRPDWRAASEYWTLNSPIARGNAFNTTARKNLWYNYYEIHLENGKFLDSYVPPTAANGNVGEIISRKATDLVDIELATFERYLNEIHTKYAAGTIVRSNVYSDLDGKPLQGKYILEIPESNRNFKDIDQFTRLAKDKYNIELRFRPE